MNKLLFLTCSSLLLTTSIRSMSPVKKLYKNATHLYKAINHFQSIEKNKLINDDQLIDENKKMLNIPQEIRNAALAIALHKKNNDVVQYLLSNSVTDTNYIISPELISIIKNNVDTHTNQSANELASKLADHETSKQPEGVPTYYFARDFASADECISSKANVTLGYNLSTPYGIKTGNIITYIIDNTEHPASLIPYYIKKGAGAYAISRASKGGSSLHHVMYKLSISNGQDASLLYEYTHALIEAKPDLLNVKDENNNTAYDCLKAIQRDRKTCGFLKQFVQLFEHHSKANVMRKSNRE